MDEEIRLLRKALVKIERLTDEEQSPLIDRIRYAAAYGLEMSRAARKKAEAAREEASRKVVL